MSMKRIPSHFPMPYDAFVFVFCFNSFLSTHPRLHRTKIGRRKKSFKIERVRVFIFIRGFAFLRIPQYIPVPNLSAGQYSTSAAEISHDCHLQMPCKITWKARKRKRERERERERELLSSSSSFSILLGATLQNFCSRNTKKLPFYYCTTNETKAKTTKSKQASIQQTKSSHKI